MVIPYLAIIYRYFLTIVVDSSYMSAELTYSDTGYAQVKVALISYFDENEGADIFGISTLPNPTKSKNPRALHYFIQAEL